MALSAAELESEALVVPGERGDHCLGRQRVELGGALLQLQLERACPECSSEFNQRLGARLSPVGRNHPLPDLHLRVRGSPSDTRDENGAAAAAELHFLRQDGGDEAGTGAGALTHHQCERETRFAERFIKGSNAAVPGDVGIVHAHRHLAGPGACAVCSAAWRHRGHHHPGGRCAKREAESSLFGGAHQRELLAFCGVLRPGRLPFRLLALLVELGVRLGGLGRKDER